jgi:MICOS complex subunit MIC60
MLRGLSRARPLRLPSAASSAPSAFRALHVLPPNPTLLQAIELTVVQRTFSVTQRRRANEPPRTPLTPGPSPAHPTAATPPPPATARTPHSPISPTSATNQPITASTAPPLPPPPPPPKKRRSLFRPRNLLFLLLVSALGYSGAVWYSFRSDNFHDFFTEYVPGSQQAIHWVQDYEYKQRYPGMGVRKGDRTSDLAGKGPHISALKANAPAAIEKKKEEIKKTEEAAKKKAKEEQEKKDAKSVQLVPKVEEPAKSAPEPPPATKENPAPPPPAAKEPSPPKPEPEKPSPAPPVKLDSPATEPTLGRLHITLLDISPNDEVIEKLSTSLNDLIKSFNATPTYDPTSGPLYEFLKSQITALNEHLPQIAASSKADAEAQIQAQARYFEQLHNDLKAALLEETNTMANEWMTAFDRERDVLQERYNERLAEELKKQNEVNDARLENELLEQAIALRRRWMREIQSQVEMEREGRLGKLADLEKQLGELIGLHQDSHAIFAKGEKAKKTAIAVQALKDAALTTGGGFIPQLATLKALAGNDDLVRAAIATIDPDAYTHGVVSLADLAARFQTLSTELRKISLLPEDAGVGGHAASWVLSKFMFRQRGYVKGDDVDSRLARVEALLEGGQLEDATREVNSFEGWGRELSRDWLRDARKRLEVCQAIDVPPLLFWIVSAD